ncbi:hypothetical protein EK21DRAFT_77930 [Setomelanomma holmii]|uniref:Uncharacterized protein n=1 Tax=Setomelanomma holmii TaxID=210430 RepID=A0A9P4LH21_9PLEO|nr:hypothetical protein EK21DRAFT_77930 [Setomelanomma holmii]
MYLLTFLLCSSALVHAAPRFTPRENLITDIGLTRMTSNAEAQATIAAGGKACGSGLIQWPQNDCPLPVDEGQGGQQLSLYSIPASTPNTITIHNYCDYDIHYLHLGASFSDSGVLRSKDTFTSPLIGTVWKGDKSPDIAHPVQVEYVVAQDTGLLWYDLSLIDCLARGANGLRTKDTSKCAGHELGLQFGNKDMISWQCKPGAWCDDQMYFYEPELGVTMEFCAANKK